MKQRRSAIKLAASLACCALASGALGACASAVATSSFKGEEHEVAQTISNLQADATSGDQKKVCERDLAHGVVASLGGSSGCEAALKEQLVQIDSLQLEIKSITLSGTRASARVSSTYAGKLKQSSLSLVKEGGKWKIAGL